MKLPIFRISLGATASLLPLSLAGVIVFLVLYLWPAIQYNALRERWAEKDVIMGVTTINTAHSETPS